MKQKLPLGTFAILSLICTVTFADYCGNFPEKSFGGASDLKYTDLYRNYEFAFTITIPHDLIGYGAALPLPDHGIGIVLSWEPRSYIYAGADYNSHLYETLETAKSDHIKWITRDSISVVSVKDLPTVIDDIESIRFAVRHTCPNLNGIYVDDYVLAFRPDNSVLYTISLLTTEERYSKDKIILEKLARSLRMDEIEEIEE